MSRVGTIAFIAAASMLLVILVVPLTRAALLESMSVHFGGWSHYDNGPYDADTWVPNEQPVVLAGADGALMQMLENDKATRDKAFVDKYPDDLRIISLFIGHNLRGKGTRPGPDATAEEVRRYEVGIAKLEALIPVIERAEVQDPQNAFFQLTKAIAFEYLDKRPAAISALRRANELPNYHDYWNESYALYASHQNSLVYRIRPVLSESLHFAELNRFARRMANLAGPESMEIRCLLLNCTAKAATSAHTSDEVNFAKIILRTCAIPSFTSLRDKLDRSVNEGDTLREIVRLQDQLNNSGFKLHYDLAAFYASEPDASFVVNRIFGGDWRDQLEITYGFYVSAVITTLVILEALVGIAAFCIVLLPVARLKALRLPPIGVPALIAAITAVAATVAEGSFSPGMAFVSACYLFSLILSFDKRTNWAPLVVGLLGTASAFTFLALADDSENFLVPGIVYALCLPIYAIVWKKQVNSGWIVPTLGVLVVGLAVAGFMPVPLLFRVMHFVTFALLAILGISLWFRCEVFEAARRLLRCAPIAVLLTIIALLASVAWQALLTYEIDRQLIGEAEYTQRWRANIREIVDSQ